MCGLAGFSFVDDALLERMSAALQHRGPDDRGEHTEPGFSLCHRRLAIVDPTERGRQPMYDEDQHLAAVVNGEIYNYPELRDRLVQQGHRLRSECDSEVVLHLFQEHGPDCFAMLDGMFALALLDRRERCLYLATDHLGIKNLYWTVNHGRLIFSSDLRPLLQCEQVDAEPDQAALDDILTYGYTPSPAAPIRGMQLLQPGTYLCWREGRHSIERYHAFTRAAVDATPERLLELVDQAVAKCLMSDVPLAVALSGGLDSTLVLALAARRHPQIQALYLEVPGMESELEAARQAAGHVGVPLTELRLTDYDLEAHLPAIVRSHEVPQDTGSMVPKWYLAREASRRGLKVVLGGSGADEVWYGYRRHPWLHAQIVDGRPTRELEQDYFERFMLRYGRGDPWLLDAYRRESPWVDICAYFDVFHELPYYHNRRLDKMFMAFGVEYRPCLLDRALVQFGLNCPLLTKLEGGRRKAFLRKAAALVLPGELCDRPKVPLKIQQVVEDERGWLEWLIGIWKQELLNR